MKPEQNVPPRSFRRGALIILAFLWITWFLAAPAEAQEGTTDPGRPASVQRSYLPLAARVVPKVIALPGDLLIDAVEYTQAIQNPINTVPLVAGKTTVLRIYTRTTTAVPAKNVWVQVSARRGGQTLPGSPMLAGPAQTSNTWGRGELNNSFNVTLPAEWTYGDVALDIAVDAKDGYIETNESNNHFTATVRFNSVPPLRVKVIPIQYYDPPSGLLFEPPNPDFLAPALLKMYPVSRVDLTQRASIWFGQDLISPNAWKELLKRLYSIKRADRSPSYEVYYGFIPTKHSSGVSWFNGGIIGLGWLGARLSMGVAGVEWAGQVIPAADVAGHEIGHNLGREHSPCGVSPSDPKFPYRDGSIGQYGFTSNPMQVLAPQFYTDIMGYCPSKWVADYTYANLYLHQTAYGGPMAKPAPEAPGLLVRADVAEDGALSLDPFYQFTGEIDPPADNSPYALEYLDEAGAVIASYPLAELFAEEPQISVHAIIALAPLPERPFAAVRVVQRDPVSGMPQMWAEKRLLPNQPALAAAPTLQTLGDQVVLRWGAPQIPSLVRYTINEGQEWTTVAIDALGGQIRLARSSLPSGNLLFEVALADASTNPYRLEWHNQP